MALPPGMNGDCKLTQMLPSLLPSGVKVVPEANAEEVMVCVPTPVSVRVINVPATAPACVAANLIRLTLTAII